MAMARALWWNTGVQAAFTSTCTSTTAPGLAIPGILFEGYQHVIKRA